MVQRHFPAPEQEPAIRVTVRGELAVGAVVETAVEVLLAGSTDDPGTIAAAVRAAVTTVLGDGVAGPAVELELARSGGTLRASLPAGGRGGASTPSDLADQVSAAGGRLTLTWILGE